MQCQGSPSEKARVRRKVGEVDVDVVEVRRVHALRQQGARVNGMVVPKPGTSGTQLMIMDRVARKEVVVQTNLKLDTKGTDILV